MKNLKRLDRVIFDRNRLSEGVVIEVSPSTNFVKVEYSGFGRCETWIKDDEIVEILEPKKARWF